MTKIWLIVLSVFLVLSCVICKPDGENTVTNEQSNQNSTANASSNCESILNTKNVSLRCENGTYYLEGDTILIEENDPLTIRGHLIVLSPNSTLLLYGANATLEITGYLIMVAPLIVRLELSDFTSEHKILSYGHMVSTLETPKTTPPQKTKNQLYGEQVVNKQWIDANFSISFGAPSCATFSHQKVVYKDNSVFVLWSGRKCDKTGADMTVLVAICAASGIVLLIAIMIPVQQWSLMVFMLAAEFRSIYRKISNTLRSMQQYQALPTASPTLSPVTSPLVSPVPSSVTVIDV